MRGKLSTYVERKARCRKLAQNYLKRVRNTKKNTKLSHVIAKENFGDDLW